MPLLLYNVQVIWNTRYLLYIYTKVRTIYLISATVAKWLNGCVQCLVMDLLFSDCLTCTVKPHFIYHPVLTLESGWVHRAFTNIKYRVTTKQICYIIYIYDRYILYSFKKTKHIKKIANFILQTILQYIYWNES